MWMTVVCLIFFFFKQKTAYEMRISDWSSDVCSSDLNYGRAFAVIKRRGAGQYEQCRAGSSPSRRAIQGEGWACSVRFIRCMAAAREGTKGAPNIFLIMTDDAGFAASSVFGGPIPTPNLQRLADAGLRYNRFHTAGICSPTRAALLTGRNQHAVATGNIVDVATGFPGYLAEIPKSAASVSEV